MKLTGLPLFLIVALFAAPPRAANAADAERAQATRPTPAEQRAMQPSADWLVLEPVGQYGRAPVHTDALEAAIIAERWRPPQPGDKVRVSESVERTWQEVAPDEQGWVRHPALRGGYACLTVECEAERVMILEAAGHSTVYVNGVPRAGDPYATNWVRLPVRLRSGTNTLLFHVGRGRVRAGLVDPRAPAEFNTRDLTLPDILRGNPDPPGQTWAALPVINATDRPLSGLVIEASCVGGTPVRTELPPIPPLSTRKVGWRIGLPPELPEAKELEVRLELRARLEDGSEELLDTAELKLSVRRPQETHKRTFISAIDGSVQYYAATPAESQADEPLALFLTLHGAGVEASGQARAYAPKSWGHVVAPTNRRPFGFDWEDWGRLDALEVLELACRRWRIDPRRIYLTGHSMGGHGVWQLGAQFPDRFAAIGPSAAWPDFWSYAGAAEYENPTPIEQILMRAVSPSRTLALSRNYLHFGVYILHGQKDDNVPVELGRLMRRHLAEFHPDFAYYERPGAGHWWGNACVDWPPLFDFFRHHVRPASSAVRHIEFHTANPAVSASSHWVTIEAQQRQGEVSSVTIDLDLQQRRFRGTTGNVARLSIDLGLLAEPPPVGADSAPEPALPAGQPLTIELDGQKLENVPWPQDEPRLWLRHDTDGWLVISRPTANLKNPRRYGPFKQAFRQRFAFVYATHGTAADNAAAYNKARYDAETFWYRANGTVDLVADVDFDPAAERDRNVILYGNADTSAAWAALLGESPVQVHQGMVTVGRRELSGDLACLFIRPRPGSDRALVGVVAGTGPLGLRLTERLPYFVSGIAYPDCIVLGPEVLSDGTAGIRAAGFFGLDWSVENGDFAWRD